MLSERIQKRGEVRRGGRRRMPHDRLHLPAWGRVPNNPQPARLYRAARTVPPTQVGAHLAANGWTNAWQGGIYPFTHDHSTAHEVLVIARGQAHLTLGGRGGPQVTVTAGDALTLPAGNGHRNDGSRPDLLVIGAYAQGRDWDTCRPETTGPQAARTRAERDPISGNPWSAGT